MAVLLTEPKIRFFDNNGNPLAGGKIYTYTAGTTTPKATYTDAGGLTSNANPVILDSAGYANIWISGSYKIVVKDSADSTISTTDNITGFSTGTTGATFSDSAFTVQDDVDPTKQMMFQLSGLSTGTTITLTAPTASGTLARTADLIGVVGTIRNGKMSVTAASATATFTADELIMETALGGTVFRKASYSQAVNLASTGAGGMDTGTAPVSGWVSLYAIAKVDGTTSILACAEATSNAEIYGGANMPSGYVYSMLLAVRRTNGSSQFTTGYTLGRKTWHGTSVNVLSVASGASPTTFTSITITSGVPIKASALIGTLGALSSNYSNWQIAASSAGYLQRSFFISESNSAQTTDDGFTNLAAPFEFPLPTSQTLYYKMAASSNDARMNINGYEI